MVERAGGHDDQQINLVLLQRYGEFLCFCDNGAAFVDAPHKAAPMSRRGLTYCPVGGQFTQTLDWKLAIDVFDDAAVVVVIIVDVEAVRRRVGGNGVET